MKPVTRAVLILALALPFSAHASIAYGSIDNFDCVNDTGQPCHGFEIEIEDIHCTDITYTYDWNHYGTPHISEDNSVPQHPVVHIRYESSKNQDGSWAAFTAVPAGPISPTDGHQFTNPSVNFGGEHFGVGCYGVPTAVRYNWLVDDGSGNLVHGGVVNISTPTFTYLPPVGGAPAQVQAGIQVPDPEVHVKEFGDPIWVKETRTTSHNNHKVELRDLVSDDPNDAHDTNWKNGEPDEVEVEWQLLQTEFAVQNGGVNGELNGAPEDLPHGDEVITRRYDFFKYVGPIDPENGEAQTDNVGPDGIHGSGVRNIGGVDVDLSTVVVVGDYIGAQMAGFDAAGQLGLIDHLQDGEKNVAYVDRTIVVQGTPPITTTRDGALPDGMDFDVVTGILSGTPTVSGHFTFTVHSTDSNNGDVSKIYDLTIAEAGAVVPAHFAVSTSASPAEGGSTTGDGDYENGVDVTVEATANNGYTFVNWTEAGSEVSTSPSYKFAIDRNRDLVANFTSSNCTIATSASPIAGGSTSGDGSYTIGDPVEVIATANAGYAFVNWTENGTEVSTNATYDFTASGNRTLVANFTQSVSDTPKIKKLDVDNNITGGDKIEIRIVLKDAAPAGGCTINLKSSNTAVLNLPATAFIAAGKKQVVVNASTTSVSQTTKSRITATLGDSKKHKNVTIHP